MAFALTMKMDVYTRSASGAFDLLDEGDLNCRLFDVSRDMSASNADRSELAEAGNLHFAPDYVMPETAQIELTSPADLAGSRFNVQRNSVRRIAPFASIIQQRCDVIRAKVT